MDISLLSLTDRGIEAQMVTAFAHRRQGAGSGTVMAQPQGPAVSPAPQLRANVEEDLGVFPGWCQHGRLCAAVGGGNILEKFFDVQKPARLLLCMSELIGLTLYRSP